MDVSLRSSDRREPRHRHDSCVHSATFSVSTRGMILSRWTHWLISKSLCAAVTSYATVCALVLAYQSGIGGAWRGGWPKISKETWPNIASRRIRAVGHSHGESRPRGRSIILSTGSPQGIGRRVLQRTRRRQPKRSSAPYVAARPQWYLYYLVHRSPTSATKGPRPQEPRALL
jgi:hypothetical protein